jgi:hypothetical protein
LGYIQLKRSPFYFSNNLFAKILAKHVVCEPAQLTIPDSAFRVSSMKHSVIAYAFPGCFDDFAFLKFGHFKSPFFLPARQPKLVFPCPQMKAQALADAGWIRAMGLSDMAGLQDYTRA